MDSVNYFCWYRWCHELHDFSGSFPPRHTVNIQVDIKFASGTVPPLPSTSSWRGVELSTGANLLYSPHFSSLKPLHGLRYKLVLLQLTN